jgi:hypothetical protein
MESTKEVNDINAARISQTRISCAQSTIGPSPENKKLSTTGTSPLVGDSAEDSPCDSPTRAQRALRRMHAFPPKFKMQPSISRLPSEMPQYPDVKRSDSNETQQELLTSGTEDTNLEHHYGRDDANLVENSEFGVDLFRCKTPDRDPSVEQITITHAIIDRPSLDEIEETNASIALEILGTRGNQVHSAANPICSIPRPVGSAVKGTENAEPAHSEEFIKVC